jgi:hypothetical protein
MPATTTEAAAMKTMRPFLAHVARGLALAAMLLLAAHARPAAAETRTCTAVPSLPYTIATQGTYCLTDDLTTAITTGNAITITANNVVLDLNGHRLSGLPGGTGTEAYGIYASKRQNITIHNGTIRGFYVGVFLDDDAPYTSSQGHVIEDVRTDQATAAGISVRGRACTLRRNQVIATGGTTLFANPSAVGIVVVGPGHRVLDNDVMTVTAAGSGVARGIWLWVDSGGSVAASNRIAQVDVGIELAVADAKYKDNLTSSVAVPYYGGTDAGHNN